MGLLNCKACNLHFAVKPDLCDKESSIYATFFTRSKIRYYKFCYKRVGTPFKSAGKKQILLVQFTRSNCNHEYLTQPNPTQGCPVS